MTPSNLRGDIKNNNLIFFKKTESYLNYAVFLYTTTNIDDGISNSLQQRKFSKYTDLTSSEISLL